MVSNPAAAAEEVTVAVSAQDNASGVIDGIIGSLGSLNKKSLAVAGGGIAALGTAIGVDAVQAAADWESALLDLEKVAGEGVAKGLEEDLKSMAERIPLTAERLAGLAEEAARFGIEGEESIRQFVENTAKMSTATQLNTNQAAEAFAKLSELTNTPINQVENLGSSINTLSNDFSTTSQEIVDASLRSASALNQFGLQQTEIFGLNAAMNTVSESSERAGTRLRRLTQELMNPDAAATFAEPLGLTAAEFERMRDEEPDQLFIRLVETMQEGGDAADQLRGELSTTSRQALSSLAQKGDQVTEAIKTSNQAFEEGTSLQREFRIESEKAGAQAQNLSSIISNIQRDLGDGLLPTVKDAMSVLRDVTLGFKQFNDRTDGMAAKVGLAGTVVGGLAIALGSIAAMVSGPVVAAVAAIGAVIGAVAIAWSENWGNIQQITEDVITEVSAIIDETVAFIQSLIDEHGADMKQSFRQTVEFIRFLWRNFGKQYVQTVREFLELVVVIAKPLLRNLLEFIDLITDLIAGDWEGVWESVTSILRTTLKAIPKIISAFGDLIVEAVKLLVDRMLLPFRFLKRMLVGESIIPETFAAIEQTIRSAVAPIETAVGLVIDAILFPFRATKATLTAAGGLIAKIGTGIVDGLNAARSKVGDAAGTVGDTITDAMPSYQDAVGVAGDIIDGLVDGLKAGIDRVGDAAGAVSGAVRKNFPGSDAETGPLSDFTASTEALGRMPVEGIERHIPDIERAAQRAARAASQTTDNSALGSEDVARGVRRADRTDDLLQALNNVEQAIRRLEQDGTDRGGRYGAVQR